MWEIDPEVPDAPLGEETLAQVVTACTSVKKLHIWSRPAEWGDCLSADAIHRAIASSAGTLDTLELVGTNEWESEDLSALFSRYQHLKYLRIDTLPLKTPFHVPSPPTFRLRSLEVRDIMAARVVNALLGNSLESLESLAIGGSVDGAALALERFPRLSKIILHWPTGSNSFDAGPLFKSLSLCTTF